MSFVLNPCTACMKKLRRKGQCNLHQLNDCFVETAAAFTGVPSNDSFRDRDINPSWYGCISELAGELGRPMCELRMAEAPVFHDIPHYYPRALADTNNKQEALQICLSSCSEVTNNREACKEACYTDNDAVIEVLNTQGSDQKESSDYHTYRAQQKTTENNKTNIVLILSSVLLLTGFFLFLLCRIKKTRNFSG